jgi:hypothetical protein
MTVTKAVKLAAYNSGLAKGGVSCFYDSEVLNRHITEK